ncbi:MULTISPECIES: enoyl-CoA hydratase/isomerase family protein [unclassified Janthinobacterium]|uniref:enoyl-CoA hydratase/isomerase family protein n=1 Tax=unclassified Janthinobacterium TaxID=2610881 RepID=UPI001E298509|nr:MULTISPECIES: enoyl-CoA hydratase/isomerase family protein [unclassified Janthinobacterium]MCC7644874.1 enoyl-CoA hydratase/isomerase family protein [Janthinobacterium sp. EB271-G4-3-1]MCC7694257.1 enoyl-CoA hydratase/isomerase family protein [Janthinobacterium sp. EB271-G4-3-2]
MVETVKLEERDCPGGMKLGIITLDAPKSLHALTLDMIRAIDGALVRWASDDAIACVVLHSSTDKAFCAGGDVRSLRSAVAEQPGIVPNPQALAFFAEEYRLDHRIHTYVKPLLVWGGGIVMGGGLGLMAGASHRVVTESTRIAMPEITIGLFPDVGGSWFLGRMPGRSGLFLGLTGAPMNAADALFTGLGDYFLRQEERAMVLDSLALAQWQASPQENSEQLDRLLRGFSAPASMLPVSEVRANFDAIAALTQAPTLPEVVAAIAAYDGDSAWLQKAAHSLAKGAPSSAALVWAMRDRTRHMSLAQVFQLELIVAVQCCAHADFSEGVRALLIDKDNAPQWQPASLADVSATHLDEYFAAPWTQHPLADLH